MSIWRQDIVSYLRALAGVEGKSPAEPPIVSMGSTNTPFIERPQFLVDHIVSDGAQVTRPSIDPYREPTETEVYLFDGELRLSMPFIIGGLGGVDYSDMLIIIYTCFRMGVAIHLESRQPPELHADLRRFIFLETSLEATAQQELSPAVITIKNPDAVSRVKGLEDLKTENLHLIARVPCHSQQSVYVRAVEAGFKALMIDEDLGGDTPLEIAVAQADRALKKARLGDYPARYLVSLFAASNRIRSSADIFKLGGLGADACVIRDTWRIGVDYRPGLPPAQLSERLENLLIGLQREVKLLMGAAGASSFQSSIVGSRELFRALDLPQEVLSKLGVKPAGE